MKYFLLLFAFCATMNTFAQNASIDLLAELPTTIKSGDCFYAYPTLSTNEATDDGFLITIYPATFEDSKLILTEEERLQKIANNENAIALRKKHKTYTIRTIQSKHSPNNPFKGDGLYLCVKEIPSIDTPLPTKAISKTGLTIPIRKLVQPARVSKQYLKKKPAQLQKNQYWFEAGNWSKLTSVNP